MLADGMAGDDFLTNFISGGLTGAAVKTAAAPVERVKLLMQTQAMNAQIDVSSRYRSVFDCIKRVYAEQGLVSFWRGNSATVLRYIPNQALNFSLKDRFKSTFGAGHSKSGSEAAVLNFVAGGAAGAASLTLCYPLDMARTRLAADVGTGASRRYLGLLNCIKVVVQNSGISGVYQGFGVSLFGAILFRALYMGGYDTLKSHYSLDQSSMLLKYSVAQAVTTSVGTFCYPIDTLKRRMMISGSSSSETVALHVLTARSCFQEIVAKEGYKGFYSGLSVNIIRGIGGAMLLVGYDEVKRMLT